MTRKANCF